MRKHILILAAFGAAILVTGAGASIPSATGVFTACVSPTATSGVAKGLSAVALLDPSLSATCPTGTTLTTWNQAGQPGPQGPPGPAGKDGANGVSVTSFAEAPGANCPNGGARFKSASPDTFACNGAPGAPGANGTNGTNGTNGADGVSVTSAAEPAGTNCANGGSKFTAANNNVTYACNGAAGSGDTVSVTDSLGTAGLTANSSFFTVIPGLSQTINVQTNSSLTLSTDGGFAEANLIPNSDSVIDIAVFVDGSLVSNGFYKRLVINEPAAGRAEQFAYWSMSGSLSLQPGSHTIAVGARLFAGQAATVSGTSGSVLQGREITSYSHTTG